MTATSERVTSPQCPPWCAGHNDAGYQEWYEDGYTGAIMREHAGPGVYVPQTHVGAEVVVEEVAGPDGLSMAATGHVWLYTAPADEQLTPAQARELAAVLAAKADELEAWQEAQR